MKQTNIFEKYPRVTIVVVLCVAIVISDIMLANIYKLIVGYPFSQKAQIESGRSERIYRVSSDIYHHDLRKNIKTDTAKWGSHTYSVATDSLGFKNSAAFEIPLASRKHRIMFIGDSFTEGVGIEYSRTFVGLIAGELSPLGIEVMNAGVSSYSPIIYWRKIKHLLEDVGLKFNELVVFIDISDIQDEARFYRLSDRETVVDAPVRKRKNWWGKFIRNNSILLNLYSLWSAPVIDDPDMEIRGKWTLDKDIYQKYGAEGLEKSAHFMDLLYQLARKHRIKLTIAVYPWPEQILGNDRPSIQSKYWANWARKRSVAFLDYFPVFIDGRKNKNDNMQMVKKYYFEGDSHWNENGHKLIAERYLRFRSETSNDVMR